MIFGTYSCLSDAKGLVLQPNQETPCSRVRFAAGEDRGNSGTSQVVHNGRAAYWNRELLTMLRMYLDYMLVKAIPPKSRIIVPVITFRISYSDYPS